MELLNEDVLYGANELQKLKLLYNRSSVTIINYKDDSDKKLLARIIQSLGFNNKISTSLAFACLKAAVNGPDTRSNYSLLYIKGLSKSNGILDKHIDFVIDTIDLINNKTIDFSEDDIHLFNDSLYNRNQNDFKYAVMSFDAVNHKKENYFDLSSNGTVKAIVPSELFAEYFTDKNVGSYYAGNDDDVASTYSKNVINSDLPVDSKYFYVNKTSSSEGTIIPSGVNSTNTNKRTIWNYMELWTNTVGREDTSTDMSISSRAKRNEKKQALQKGKKLVNNSNMTDATKQQLMSYMDTLYS